MYDHTDNLLDELGITDVKARDILHMKDYKGEGYSISTKKERGTVIYMWFDLFSSFACYIILYTW